MSSEQQESQTDSTRHGHVVCDGCQGEVRDIRYKCLTCPDYDLCILCIDKSIHDEHPMIRIASPKDETWKPAFVASQAAIPFASILSGRHRFFEQCQERRRCHHGGQSQNVEESEKMEETKEKQDQPKQGEQAQPEFFNEEVVRNLGEAMSSIWSAFGMPVCAFDTEAPEKQKPAEVPVAEEANSASIHHADPKIDAALNYMLAMGYKNDGGWLTTLLEEKRGNVSAVLDILHPNPVD